MKTLYNLKMIGFTFILLVLICAGFFFYSEWDLKRFQESLAEVPVFSSDSLSQGDTKTEETPEAAASPLEVAPEPPVEHASDAPLLELDPEVFPSDAFQNDSLPVDEFAVQPEPLEKDDIALDDASPEEIYSSIVFESLISALESGNVDIGSGTQADLNLVVETLKLSASGAATVDDLLTMTEAWLRIQPDAPHVQIETQATRKSLTALHTWLRAAKEEELQTGEQGRFHFDLF